MTKTLPSKSALRNDSDCKKPQNPVSLNLRLGISSEGDSSPVKGTSVRAMFQKRNSKIFKSPQSPKSLDSDLHLTATSVDDPSLPNESSSPSLLFESAFY